MEKTPEIFPSKQGKENVEERLKRENLLESELSKERRDLAIERIRKIKERKKEEIDNQIMTLEAELKRLKDERDKIEREDGEGHA